jgi:hypothetical protein
VNAAGVTLDDQFGSATVTAGRLVKLCTPAQLNDDAGEPLRPDAHQAMYGLTPRGPAVRKPHPFFDEFTGDTGVVLTPTLRTTLLVPAGKSTNVLVTPPIPTGVDHYECYALVQPTAPSPVSPVKIADQFGAASYQVGRASEACTPVDVNGNDATAPDHLGHLVCYDVARTVATMPKLHRVRVNDEFGARTLLLHQANELCVPAFKDAVPTTTTSTSTTTSSTTTTTMATPEPGPAIRFTTSVASGICGHTYDAASNVIDDLDCAKLYLGGALSVVPPGTNPDGATNRFLITGCTGSVCTLGPAAVATPDFDCSAPGCSFGPPLPIPVPANPGTNSCVVNTFAAPASGTIDLSTGESSIAISLSSHVFLTGKPSPCPTCRVGTPSGPACAGTPASPCVGVCDRDVRKGLSCTSTNSAGLSSNCLPTLSDVGTIPVNLTPVVTGTVSMTADGANNFCPSQRDPGCFDSLLCHSITETGVSGGPLVAGTPATVQLATTFCVPETGGVADAVSDLPGPGATTLPGTILLEP